MTGRIINESDALRLAGELARVAPSEYGRMKGILARCPTVNVEGAPLEQETMEQTIKRVVAEQIAAFKLPDGVRPKEVRLTATYDGLMASITLEIPEENTSTKQEKGA